MSLFATPSLVSAARMASMVSAASALASCALSPLTSTPTWICATSGWVATVPSPRTVMVRGRLAAGAAG